MTAPSTTDSGAPWDAPPPERDEIRFREVIGVLRRGWRIVVVSATLAGAIMVAASFLMDPVYTATTSFMPVQSNQPSLPSGLAGLAGQFGAVLGGGSGGSPRVYAAIVKSREATDRVLSSRYPVPGRVAADSATLLDILKIEGDTPRTRLERGEKLLASRINVSLDNLTGVVKVTVDAGDRDLAANIANRLVGVLNELNALAHQSAVVERSRFIERRRAEAGESLRAAEAQLRPFYESNRTWQSSPQLVFEEGRLRRQVDLRQEIYLTLARQYEQARIEHENNVNAITVLDRAVPPVVRSAPNRRKLLLLGLVIGGLFGVGWLFVRDYRRPDAAADALRTVT